MPAGGPGVEWARSRPGSVCQRDLRVRCGGGSIFFVVVSWLAGWLVVTRVVDAQLLTILLEKPTDDSVELAVSFVKESGATMMQLCREVPPSPSPQCNFRPRSSSSRDFDAPSARCGA